MKPSKLPDSVTAFSSLMGNYGKGYLRYPINCEKCEVIVSPARTRQRFCKDCGLIHRKELMKKWRIAHPKYKKGWLIAYSKSNPEKYAEYIKNQREANQIWSDKHIEDKAKYNKEYRLAHREKIKALWQDWYSKNKNGKQEKNLGI